MVTTQLRRVPSLFITSMVLFIVGLFLFIALLNNERNLIILCLLVFCMTGGLKLWTRSSPSGIRCNISLHKNRIFVGDRFALDVLVENNKLLPVFLEVDVPVDGSVNVFNGEGALKRGGSLLWRQMMHFWWELKADKRGVYKIGPASILSGDLLGFFQKESAAGDEFQVVVYPKLVPLASLYLPKHDFFGIPGGESPVNDPVYILGTNDYQHGRPARYIHWKASARHYRLQEKVFESTQQEKVLLIIDVAQFVQHRADEAFERTLEVVASLAVRLDRQGCAIGLLTNAAVKEASPVVSVTRSALQLSNILETLARLQMELKETIVDMLQNKVSIPWGTTCIYFSFHEDETMDVAKEMLRSRKTPVVLLTFEGISSIRMDMPVHGNIPGVERGFAVEENHFQEARLQ